MRPAGNVQTGRLKIVALEMVTRHLEATGDGDVMIWRRGDQAVLSSIAAEAAVRLGWIADAQQPSLPYADLCRLARLHAEADRAAAALAWNERRSSVA